MTRRGQVPGWRQRWAERLDRLLALPMLVLTVVFLVVMVLPVLFPGLPPAARAVLEAVDLGIWAVFVAEYLARLFVAPNRGLAVPCGKAGCPWLAGPRSWPPGRR